MTCPHCRSTATVERPDRTALGYRRFRCRPCKQGLNERTGTPLNRLGGRERNAFMWSST
jgi:putative transposase